MNISTEKKNNNQMKLPDIDRTTLDFLIRVSEYGNGLEFNDILFEYFFRSRLESLKKKLSNTKGKIREAYTLNLPADQAICIRWTLEIWNNKIPGTLADKVLKDYFELDNAEVKAVDPVPVLKAV